MARFTAAYKNLTERLDEVTSLQRLARELSSSNYQENTEKVNSLCRAAVVLLSSHLEGYVRNLGELTLEKLYEKEVDRNALSLRLFYHISGDIIDEIQNTRDGEKIAKKVFHFLTRDGEFWSREGPFAQAISPERFTRGFANPTCKKIKSFLARFGYDAFTHDLKRRLKVDYPSHTNMIEHVVEIRNKIAHGDLDTKNTPHEIEEMARIVKKFCATLDSGFGNWCTANLCVIR